MLASAGDVIRILRQTETPDLINKIEPVLEAVDDWVHTAYHGKWDTPAGTVVTETFFNPTQDALLKLGDVNPTNISLQIFVNSPTDAVSDLFDNSSKFDVMDNGTIRLTSSIYITIPAFPNAWARRFLRRFHKVVVTYTASGIIPATIREAVALIAAASYDQQPTDINNIKSESIGGYSYTLEGTYREGNTAFVIPQRARHYLQPYARGLTARAI